MHVQFAAALDRELLYRVETDVEVPAFLHQLVLDDQPEGGDVAFADPLLNLEGNLVELVQKVEDSVVELGEGPLEQPLADLLVLGVQILKKGKGFFLARFVMIHVQFLGTLELLDLALNFGVGFVNSHEVLGLLVPVHVVQDHLVFLRDRLFRDLAVNLLRNLPLDLVPVLEILGDVGLGALDHVIRLAHLEVGLVLFLRRGLLILDLALD